MIDWFYLVASHRLSESHPLKFLYFRQNVFSAKSSFVKLSVRRNVRSTKCSFDKVSVRKMSLRQNVFRQNVFRQSVFRQNVRQPSISNEAVLFIRDEAGDMVVEIVAYTTLMCLAIRWTTVRFDDSFAKFFGSLFVDMCYFSRLSFRWQSTTFEGIIKKGAQAWSNSFIPYRYFQYTGWISFSPCNLLPFKLRKYS